MLFENDFLWYTYFEKKGGLFMDKLLIVDDDFAFAEAGLYIC